MADATEYLYVTTALDSAERMFHLQEVEGEEGISTLFKYNLFLRALDDSLDFSGIVGEVATVTIERENGTHRYISGLVTHFTQGNNDGIVTNYHAEIRPTLWRLTQTTNSKIYQNMTVPQIIADVFGEFGLTDFADRTTQTYQPRIYCVQYQETAFNFVSRLMEDEGIFYFFEHESGKHTLVLADDADAHAACPGLSEAEYRPVEMVTSNPDNYVELCTKRQQLITNKYAVEDYHFETSTNDLLTDVDAKETGSFRRYEYPGGYTVKGDGDTIVSRRMQEYEVPHTTVDGTSYCRAFIAGCKFTLTKHYRSDMNADYVIRKLNIKVNQERYINTFEGFPVSVPFRPPRTAFKPRINSTQTALVVGKSGEEIHTDEYGRVKVQFHWDQLGAKDENSSCWVRVTQFWAGKNFGALFTPRIGMEVVVSYLNGDPDRPLIMGAVYNDVQKIPYNLPGEMNTSTIKTWSTKQGEAGNEIRFVDTKGEEELYFHAQKDNNILVENDRKKDVLHDETMNITNNRTATILEGNESLTVEKGDRTVNVKTGKETYDVKDTRTITVTGDETRNNKANYTQNVTKDYTLKVDGDLTIDVKGKVTIKSGDKMNCEAGGNLTNTTKGSMTSESSSSMTIKSGSSMNVKSSSGMTLKAGSTFEAKGSSSGTLDGGGSTTIKGGSISVG